MTSRWRVAETTLLEVGGLPPGAEVNVEVKLVFGALWTQWVEGPFVADASGALTWAPALDREAYLHPLASDFVTDLAVRLEVVSGTSRELVSADPAVVAFPDGQRGDPVVWDLATMNDRAPRGVLSPSLRALLGDSTGRARPPVPYAVRPPVEPVQQEDDR